MIKKLIDDVIGDRVLLVEEDEVSPEVMFNHENSKLMTRFSYSHVIFFPIIYIYIFELEIINRINLT